MRKDYTTQLYDISDALRLIYRELRRFNDREEIEAKRLIESPYDFEDRIILGEN